MQDPDTTYVCTAGSISYTDDDNSRNDATWLNQSEFDFNVTDLSVFDDDCLLGEVAASGDNKSENGMSACADVGGSDTIRADVMDRIPIHITSYSTGGDSLLLPNPPGSYNINPERLLMRINNPGTIISVIIILNISTVKAQNDDVKLIESVIPILGMIAVAFALLSCSYWRDVRVVLPLGFLYVLSVVSAESPDFDVEPDFNRLPSTFNVTMYPFHNFCWNGLHWAPCFTRYATWAAWYSPRMDVYYEACIVALFMVIFKFLKTYPDPTGRILLPSFLVLIFFRQSLNAVAGSIAVAMQFDVNDTFEQRFAWFSIWEDLAADSPILHFAHGYFLAYVYHIDRKQFIVKVCWMAFRYYVPVPFSLIVLVRLINNIYLPFGYYFSFVPKPYVQTNLSHKKKRDWHRQVRNMYDGTLPENPNRKGFKLEWVEKPKCDPRPEKGRRVKVHKNFAKQTQQMFSFGRTHPLMRNDFVLPLMSFITSLMDSRSFLGWGAAIVSFLCVDPCMKEVQAKSDALLVFVRKILAGSEAEPQSTHLIGLLFKFFTGKELNESAPVMLTVRKAACATVIGPLLVFLGFKPDMLTFNAWWAKAAENLTSLNSITVVFEAVTALFKMGFAWFYDADLTPFLEAAPWEKWIDKINEIESNRHNRLALETMGFLDHRGVFTEAMLNVIKDLRKDGVALRGACHKANTMASMQVASRITGHLARLTEMEADWVTMSGNILTKPAPVAFTIYGAPGVGKTDLIDMVASIAATEMDLETSPSNVCFIPVQDKFLGILKTQEIVKLPDFVSVRRDKGPNPNVLDPLTLLDSAPQFYVKADVSEKGKYPNRIKLFVCGTNDITLGAVETHVVPLAVLRRQDLYIWVYEGHKSVEPDTQHVKKLKYVLLLPEASGNSFHWRIYGTDTFVETTAIQRRDKVFEQFVVSFRSVCDAVRKITREKYNKETKLTEFRHTIMSTGSFCKCGYPKFACSCELDDGLPDLPDDVAAKGPIELATCEPLQRLESYAIYAGVASSKEFYSRTDILELMRKVPRDWQDDFRKSFLREEEDDGSGVGPLAPRVTGRPVAQVLTIPNPFAPVKRYLWDSYVSMTDRWLGPVWELARSMRLIGDGIHRISDEVAITRAEFLQMPNLLMESIKSKLKIILPPALLVGGTVLALWKWDAFTKAEEAKAQIRRLTPEEIVAYGEFNESINLVPMSTPHVPMANPTTRPQTIARQHPLPVQNPEYKKAALERIRAGLALVAIHDTDKSGLGIMWNYAAHMYVTCYHIIAPYLKRDVSLTLTFPHAEGRSFRTYLSAKSVVWTDPIRDLAIVLLDGPRGRDLRKYVGVPTSGDAIIMCRHVNHTVDVITKSVTFDVEGEGVIKCNLQYLADTVPGDSGGLIVRLMGSNNVQVIGIHTRRVPESMAFGISLPDLVNTDLSLQDETYSGVPMEIQTLSTRSFVHHFPDKFYFGEILGSIDETRTKTGVSMMKETPLCSIVKAEHKIDLILPPLGIVTNGDEWINPFLVKAEALMTPMPSIHPRLAEAGRYEVLTELCKIDMAGTRPYNVDEAVNGFAGVNRMRIDTAAGYPYRGKKSAYLNEVETDRYAVNPEIQQSMTHILNLWDEGLSCNVVSVLKPKDEPMKASKFLQARQRLFATTPMPFLILMRIYLGPIFDKMRDNRMHVQSAVGINAASSEWGTLATTMDDFSKFFLDVDAEWFDVYNRLLRYIVRVLIEFIEMLPWSSIDKRRARCVALELLEAVIIVNGEVIRVFYVFTSGLFGTAELNVLCMLYGLASVCRFKTACPLRLLISSKGYGDDLIFSCSDLFRAIFPDPEVLKVLFLKIGLKATDGSKSAKIEYKTIHDVKFLKRGFREELINGKKYWLAPLEVKSILKSLLFIPKNLPDEKVQYETLFSQAELQFWMHGKEAYNLWMEVLGRYAVYLATVVAGFSFEPRGYVAVSDMYVAGAYADYSL